VLTSTRASVQPLEIRVEVVQHIDLSAQDPRRLICTARDEGFGAYAFAQPSPIEDDASSALPAPDLAHRLGLIAVESAVRRSQPRRMG
jgi:hypothetical protein